jgi:methionyl-tRNA formyltransferase
LNYVYCANNRLGLNVLRWLVSEGHPPAGMVVHPPGRGKFVDELLAASGLPDDKVQLGPAMQTVDGKQWLASLRPEWIVSVMFGYILSDDILRVPAVGAVNLHPSLLPFNRGADPNVWSIVERTPCGVTLHWIDEGIDTGDIIAQMEVPVAETDTGATLYQRLEQAGLELFRQSWPLIEQGSPPRIKQSQRGTFHRSRDVAALDCIDPDALFSARALVDILRARTFPPYRNAYLNLAGRRIFLHLELEEEGASDGEP